MTATGRAVVTGSRPGARGCRPAEAGEATAVDENLKMDDMRRRQVGQVKPGCVSWRRQGGQDMVATALPFHGRRCHPCGWGGAVVTARCQALYSVTFLQDVVSWESELCGGVRYTWYWSLEY